MVLILGETMSVYKNLENLNLKEDTHVTLAYSDGTDVFVHNETDVETAIEDTGVIEALCDLVAVRGLTVNTIHGSNVIESLRESGLLEAYERDFTFALFFSDIIKENFYDVGLIDYSTTAYDYKRGFCTLTAVVDVTAKELMSLRPDLGGWTISVNTGGGTLSLEG